MFTHNFPVRSHNSPFLSLFINILFLFIHILFILIQILFIFYSYLFILPIFLTSSHNLHTSPYMSFPLWIKPFFATPFTHKLRVCCMAHRVAADFLTFSTSTSLKGVLMTATHPSLPRRAGRERYTSSSIPYKPFASTDIGWIFCWLRSSAEASEATE